MPDNHFYQRGDVVERRGERRRVVSIRNRDLIGLSPLVTYWSYRSNSEETCSLDEFRAWDCVAVALH